MNFIIFITICLLKEYKTEVQDNYRKILINGKKFIMPAVLEKHILSRFPNAKKFDSSIYNDKTIKTSNSNNLLPINYRKITNNQPPLYSNNLMQSVQSSNILQSPIKFQSLKQIPLNNNLYPNFNTQTNNKLNEPVYSSEKMYENGKIELEKMKQKSLLLANKNHFMFTPKKLNQYNIKQTFNHDKKQLLSNKNNYIPLSNSEKLKKNDLTYSESIFNLVNQPNLVPFEKETISQPSNSINTNHYKTNKKTVYKLANTKKTKIVNANALQITSEPEAHITSSIIDESILSKIKTTTTALPILTSTDSHEESNKLLNQSKKFVKKEKKIKNKNDLNETASTVMRCQDSVTKKLIPQATACKNSRSDRICSFIFKPIDKVTGKRDPKCNLQGFKFLIFIFFFNNF